MVHLPKKYDYPDTSLISYMSNKVKMYGGINLAQGIPAFQPPDELISILGSRQLESFHQYPPGNGDFLLREQILSHYHGNNLQLSDDNFLIVQGATEAIALIYLYIRTIKSRPLSVLAFKPMYESYKHLPRIYGDTLTASMALEPNGINFQLLENEVQTQKVDLIFVASPGNPYGRLWNKDEVLKIIDLAENYNVYIIFDMVYKDLCFEKNAFIPLRRLSTNVFYVNSFSKLISITGWRLGYLFFNENHLHNIKNIHDYTGLCASSVLQHALALFLQQNNYGINYISKIRKELQHNFTYLSAQLQDLHFEIPPIDGGYFIWAKLPTVFDDGFQWAMNLYERHKVAVIPGMHFADDCKEYVRFNIARKFEEIEEAAQRIQDFCNSL